MIDWITTNWDALLALLAAIHVLALAIVNLTPTPKDDEFVAKVYSFVEKIAGIFTPKAKE